MFYIEKLNKVVENLFIEALMESNNLWIWMWGCIGGSGCVFALRKKLYTLPWRKRLKPEMQCFSWVVTKLEVFNCDETWCRNTCENKKMHKKQNIYLK